MFNSCWWLILLLLFENGTGSNCACHNHSDSCRCGINRSDHCGCARETENRNSCGCPREPERRSDCGCTRDCYTKQGEYSANGGCR